MKRRFVVFLVASGLVAGCGGDRVEPGLLKDIQALEQRAFEGEEMVPEVRTALLVAYGDFARLHADHVFAPEALFRRADLLVSAGKFEQAVLQYQDLHDGYPKFDKPRLRVVDGLCLRRPSEGQTVGPSRLPQDGGHPPRHTSG